MTRTTPRRTIPAILDAVAAARPLGVALIENGRSWTFAELRADVAAVAAGCLARGIGKGDVVAVWAPNRREWILAAAGAQSVGAAVTPLNTRLKGREAGDILRRSRARLLFTVDSFLGIDYRALLAEEDLPDLVEIVTLDGTDAAGFGRFLSAGVAVAAERVAAAVAAVEEDDVCDILFTSGTTGTPKGVVSLHGATIRLFEGWAESVDLRPDDRVLVINPFFHTFGYKAGWLACLLVGATVVPLPVFDVAEVVRCISGFRITFLPGPPTIFQSLLAERALVDAGPTSLRVAVTGAATVPPVLIERMYRELGFETVVTGYGMTECGTITMCRAGDDVETIATTCGRALPGLEVVCADEAGRRLPPGVVGEVLVRGYGIMRGYLDDPIATREAIDADGWLHTGDLGTLDADGRLRITDRKKDMYITGGFNCYPAEIEKLLAHNPKVEAVAVVGIADERLGEVGKAFVVLKRGETASSDEIVAWCRDNMANYKVPRVVEFRDGLPKNASGKVVRADLRRDGG